MLAHTEHASSSWPSPAPLPSALQAATLGRAVMADDPCEAAFSAATPTGPRNYYRARYYDPHLARFLSEDSRQFVDGPNRYRYTRNRPTVGTDPTGEKTVIMFPEGHAAVWVTNGTEPYLYDPAGSYVAAGLPHHIDIMSQEQAFLGPYLSYHAEIDKRAAHVYTFCTTPSQEAAIVRRVLVQPTVVTGGLCASQVQLVIAGIGPFKGIPPPGFIPTTLGGLETMVIDALSNK